MNTQLHQLRRHQSQLSRCHKCTQMQGPVVMGSAVVSPIVFVGQAPGNKEIEVGKPFAWTAGKTLFKWFAEIGVDEKTFRQQVYMAAVCRCFPGKNPKGGDRVPNLEEIHNCSVWLHRELQIIRPQLIIPTGKLAIAQFMKVAKLNDVVGKIHNIEVLESNVDILPLPHPSGASVWHRIEPGKSLLHKALQALKRHRAWKKVIASMSD